MPGLRAWPLRGKEEMYIFDLIPHDEWTEALEQGYVRKTDHPNDPHLSIYNYTEKAQLAKHWNKATLNCRGLIVNEYGNIVARPFPKFFNYGDANTPKLSMDEPVAVTDKIDGSLGILYPTGDGKGWAVATRGSFVSEQAQHATGVWLERYATRFEPYRGWTMLFEIVYPENRIVVDYGGQDDLVFLGGVDIRSGIIMGPEFFGEWPGPRAKVFPYRTMKEALSAPPRPGKEGLVVRSLMDHSMVKLKQLFLSLR